jgi:hypothetical protein
VHLLEGFDYKGKDMTFAMIKTTDQNMKEVYAIEHGENTISISWRA